MTVVMESNDDYVLGRDVTDSIRLDAQHLLWRLHNGYTLHSEIPKRRQMRIAEVGTGTGVWLFDLAQELPDSICLHGYDISDTQFPPKELWPPNIELSLMDSFQDPPDSLIESYDVVHLRMWASNLRDKDVKTLIRSVSKLLKPGGYLQWEEANLLRQEVRGPVGKEFEDKINQLFKAARIDYSWVSGLKSSLESCDLHVVEHVERRFKAGLIQICTNTYLMALKEILAGIKRTSACQDQESILSCETLLNQLISSRVDGVVYNWGPVSSLAQKPQAL